MTIHNNARLVAQSTLSQGQNEQLWNQSDTAISLRRRLKAGEITTEQVEAAISRLNDAFIATHPGAPKRCVDGSTSMGYVETTAWQQQPLGPQIQGGTGDEAVAYRLIKGISDGNSPHMVDDMETIAHEHHSRFVPGDHTDTRADEHRSGCGAVDGQLRKLAMYSDAKVARVIEHTTQTVLTLANVQPFDGIFSRLKIHAAHLAQIEDYFPSPTIFLDTLRRLGPDGVETLVRPHNEVSVTINCVKDTTFHRDHYNAATKSMIQNFNLDAWVIFEEYEAPEATVLIADAVATLMDLTDGSLRFFIRLPS